MSYSYRVLYRSGRGGVEANRRDPEVQVISVEDMDESESEGEGQTGTMEDSTSLISKEDEIDENGVARDYEVALKHIGFGLFHVILIVINGIALLSDAVEVISVGFVLPILRRDDEFGSTDVQNAILSSVVFAGMLFGSYGWGAFADIVGRRFVMLISLTINGTFAFFSAFSPNIAMFTVFRFISGIGVGGSLPIIPTYTAEFIRNKYRGPYLGVQSFFWTFGRLVCGGIAWLILPRTIGALHSWRVFIAVSALPSLIGVLLYLLLPESPRFLLETGREKKALKVLRMVHRLNHLHKGGEDVQFSIKGVRVTTGQDKKQHVAKETGCGRRQARFYEMIKQVWSQTIELFKYSLLWRTLLLLTILFTLSFGSFGVTLWFPSYVEQIVTARETREFCSGNAPSDAVLSQYCGCEGTIFRGQHFSNMDLTGFKLSDSEFLNVTFSNVTFSDVYLEDCNFTTCVLDNVTFESRCLFKGVNWNQTVFSGVNVSGLSVCNGSSSDVVVGGEEGSGSGSVELVNVLEGGNSTCDDMEVKCKKKEEDNENIYRDLFLVSGAAFPGNVASAIAVYFLRRNYWLAFSLFASTASVFGLYVVHSEVFVVVMLCVFVALSTPAWNDSSLLIAELYPTHLRTTAAGIHLLSARVGAILGTNLFGLFIHVNPSIPILLVAGVLLVGAIAALPLPKTTRKTILQ